MDQREELSCGLRRMMLALGCVLLAFLLSMGALTVLLGAQTPLMVVESRSMQHDDNSSAIGIIDTGDVVVVSEPREDSDLMTYLGSLNDGYRSFGEYGDVVICQTPGEEVPIVHRALCELVYNSSAGGFDIPELAGVPASMWTTPGDGGWQGLSDWVDLLNVGHASVTVHIDLDEILGSMNDPHGGLITMGDNNWNEIDGARYGVIDQGTLVDEPIKWEWIIGRVVGEVPWIGTVRLWLTGTAPSYLPENTVVLLMASVISIAVLPVVLWASARAVEGRDRKRG
ncbi:MAG: hypothetical protein ISF22_06410 [Methanomassiliicoccus sp.]|nr:hypothetical protein [Methanomassiliicoccus sp.]